MEYFGRHWIAEAIVGILTFAVSILISLASYKYLESPFLKLKKYFSYAKHAGRPSHKVSHSPAGRSVLKA